MLKTPNLDIKVLEEHKLAKTSEYLILGKLPMSLGKLLLKHKHMFEMHT